MGATKYPQIAKHLERCKDAIGVGLFYLSIGHRPTEIPDGPRKKVRLSLSEDALSYLEKLKGSDDFSSEREILESALAWVSEQPSYVQLARL